MKSTCRGTKRSFRLLYVILDYAFSLMIVPVSSFAFRCALGCVLSLLDFEVHEQSSLHGVHRRGGVFGLARACLRVRAVRPLGVP